METLIAFLVVFALVVGVGYYVRDRKSRNRVVVTG